MSSKRTLSAAPSIALVGLFAVALSGSFCPPQGTLTEPVTHIEFEPEAVTLAVGGQARVRAYPQTAGGSTVRSVTWSSDRDDIVTVSTDGMLTAIAVGSTLVRATSEGVTGTVAVTVVQAAGTTAKLWLSPRTPYIGVNEDLQMVAEARDINDVVLNRPAQWFIADPSIASITPAGTVRGVAEGATMVRVTVDGFADSTLVSVIRRVTSLTITPRTASLLPSDTLRLSLAATGPAGVVEDPEVQWFSRDTSIATVQGGLVHAKHPGHTRIVVQGSALQAQNLRDSVDVTVLTPPTVASVVVAPKTASLLPGQSLQMDATVTMSAPAPAPPVTWSRTANAANIIGLTNQGVVTGIAAGTGGVIATAGGRADTAWITVTQPPSEVLAVAVTPKSPTITVGGSVTLSATVTMSAGGTPPAVSWSTTVPSVLQVSQAGVVTGLQVGSGPVIAHAGGKADTAFVFVSNTTGSTTDNVSPASRFSIKRLAGGGTQTFEDMWIGDHRENGDGTLQAFARYNHGLSTSATIDEARVTVVFNANMMGGQPFQKLGAVYVELDQPEGLNEGSLRPEAVLVASSAVGFVFVDITPLVRASVAAGNPVRLRFRFQKLLSDDSTTNMINMTVGGLEITHR